MKRLIAASLTFTLLATALAQGGVPGTQSKPLQKWEYLLYAERDDGQSDSIYVAYRHADKRYTIAEFAKAIGSEGAGGLYLNFKTDVVNYFGSQGWEMAGAYREAAGQGGPRLVMYFKRPLK
jgi:hypothetical protein